MTDEEISDSIQNLLDLGLMREEIIDGEVYYSITELGESVYQADLQRRKNQLN